jgi:hypothetical protein
MILTHLFPLVRQLSLAEQLQLLRFLAEELASRDFNELTATQPPLSPDPSTRSQRWQQWCDRYARSAPGVGLPDAALSRDSIYSDRA